jgi:hypothetical protein
MASNSDTRTWNVYFPKLVIFRVFYPLTLLS